MNFEEFAAKPLLAKGGIPVSPSRIALTADEAAEAAAEIGPCVVKAQVPTGKRGKAGQEETAQRIAGPVRAGRAGDDHGRAGSSAVETRGRCALSAGNWSGSARRGGR